MEKLTANQHYLNLDTNYESQWNARPEYFVDRKLKNTKNKRHSKDSRAFDLLGPTAAKKVDGYDEDTYARLAVTKEALNDVEAFLASFERATIKAATKATKATKAA